MKTPKRPRKDGASGPSPDPAAVAAAEPGAGAATEAPRDEAPTEAEGDGQPFVTFYVDRELFAFPMTSVREIIRMPEVVRVPLSPGTLEGVANLRGQMLPIVSLRRTFQFPGRPHDASTRVLVIEEDGGIVGFVVDRVAQVITVDRAQHEPVSSIHVAVDSDLLASLIKGVPGHPMVMLLDVPRLVRGSGRPPVAAPASRDGGRHADEAREGDGGDAQASERHLVSFLVAEQEYAFPIESVQEIVQVPEQLSQVPKARSHVLGVMTLRNRLLPLVSLRQMFHLPFEPLGAQNRIVVIEIGQGQGQGDDRRVVGIVMDAVNEVLRVPERLVDPLPAFLRSQDDGSEIEAICRLGDGKRLVSILSVTRLFASEALQEALAAGEAQEEQMEQSARAEPAESAAAAVDEEEQLVVFRLDGQEYGIAIESVQEIIRIPESITRVPKSVESLVGVVNVRGQVLPVVDFRSRFGLPAMDRDDRQRIMVFSLHGAYTGFIVDSVSEVLKVPHSAIETVPTRTAQLIGQVANLQKQRRMILILSAGQLLDSTELARLDQVRAAA